MDVKEFGSLKVYLAVMYDAVYKYPLLELSEREKDQQKSLQGKLRSRGKTGKKRK